MRKNGDYSINSEGRDSSTWSSHPGSDRFDRHETNLRNTEDVYDQCGCNQPINEADREKRVEELDELIHDKLGKYDEDTNQESSIRNSYEKDNKLYEKNQPVAEKHSHTIGEQVEDRSSSYNTDNARAQVGDMPFDYNTDNNRATATGSTIGATSSAIGANSSAIGDTAKKTDEPVDCSSDMSINDLASFSDANNGLSDENDDIIIVEQVEFLIEDPNENNTDENNSNKDYSNGDYSKEKGTAK